MISHPLSLSEEGARKLCLQPQGITMPQFKDCNEHIKWGLTTGHTPCWFHGALVLVDMMDTGQVGGFFLLPSKNRLSVNVDRYLPVYFQLIHNISY